MTKLTNSLLKRACKISNEYAEIQAKLSEAFEDRYGTTYSDVDCDQLIDILDGGTGVSSIKLTVSDCDNYMNDCGILPLKD